MWRYRGTHRKLYTIRFNALQYDTIHNRVTKFLKARKTFYIAGVASIIRHATLHGVILCNTIRYGSLLSRKAPYEGRHAYRLHGRQGRSRQVHPGRLDDRMVPLPGQTSASCRCGPEPDIQNVGGEVRSPRVQSE